MRGYRAIGQWRVSRGSGRMLSKWKGGRTTENREIFDKERREGHVEIRWHYKRRDNGTALNTILRFDVCEDEGTG